MTATELLDQLKSLPDREKSAFTELFHEWEIRSNGTKERRAPAKGEWPDFMARMKEDFPDGLPGKPLSEIVDEGRGPRP